MKVVHIFGAENAADGIWSIRINGKAKNEYQHFFDLMQDGDWLHDFFERNQADLIDGFFGEANIKDAVNRTMTEAGNLENLLSDYFGQGVSGNGVSLQHLFKPLNNLESSLTVHQKSKARIGKGWTRVYAIRLAENCYVITGGGIKLSADMRRHHLQYELIKMEGTGQWLKENGIIFPEDLNNYI